VGSGDVAIDPLEPLTNLWPQTDRAPSETIRGTHADSVSPMPWVLRGVNMSKSAECKQPSRCTVGPGRVVSHYSLYGWLSQCPVPPRSQLSHQPRWRGLAVCAAVAPGGAPHSAGSTGRATLGVRRGAPVARSSGILARAHEPRAGARSNQVSGASRP
jgi:hypothetical protein